MREMDLYDFEISLRMAQIRLYEKQAEACDMYFCVCAMTLLLLVLVTRSQESDTARVLRRSR